MKKGTKITHKAYPFNTDDGDHDIKFNSISVDEKKYNKIFDDPTYFFMQVHKGIIYGVNKLKFKGIRFTLLEPNPVTFYFSVALDTSHQIDHANKMLENSLLNTDKSWPVSVSHSYSFRVTAISIIFAFSSCEALINQMLPDYKKMTMPDGKVYTKQEIERYVGFEKKVQLVSSYKQKDFALKYPGRYKTLMKLKDLRDKLIHLKEVKQGIATSYNDIYQSLLDVDLKKMINAVRAFINFYDPKLIMCFTRPIRPETEMQ